MKRRLILIQAISTAAALVIFAGAFSLQGGWNLTGEKHQNAVAIAALVVTIVSAIATYHMFDTGIAFAAAAVSFAIVALAACRTAVTFLIFAIAAVFAAFAAWDASNSPIIYGRQVSARFTITSSLLEMAVIIGGVAAMLFL